MINQKKVNEVNDFLRIHSGSSVRSVAEASSILQTITCRVRTEHLLVKSYKAQFVRHLYEKDFQDCVEMCQMLLSLVIEPRNKSNIFCSDETVFHLNGLANKRYWSEENPQVKIEIVM